MRRGERGLFARRSFVKVGSSFSSSSMNAFASSAAPSPDGYSCVSVGLACPLPVDTDASSSDPV